MTPQTNASPVAPPGSPRSRAGLEKLRAIPAILVAFVLFLTWQVIDHLFFMDVPMPTRHLLSLIIGTTLATVIAGFANVEITRQYRQLQESERLRTDLARMLVHDLRAPLTGVMGALDAMESGTLGELTEEMGDAVGIAKRGGRRLLGMIDDLLVVSKIEAGQMQLDLRHVGLFCLTSSALELVEHSANRAKIELDMNVDPIDMEASCDYDLILRVLANLLSNAIRFTPPGGRICIDVLQEGTRVIFSVTDTGEGIPMEYHEKIFEKFGLAGSPSARRSWSTGLGLYFCKMVVELHSGQIWVESEPGKGSNFVFTLPQAVSEYAPNTSGADNVRLHAASTDMGTGGRR